METRANYLLIGIFTIGGFLGLLAFFLWFARVELDRQYDYYDVLFTSVSGLSSASEVRFAGLPVGQVVDVELDPQESGLVRVRIEVQDGTPVRVSSFATIETLGVTGVSFVGITAGNPGDPLLAEVSEDAVPDIPSRRSPLQSLADDAPEIIEEILQVSRSISNLLGETTQQRVAAILENVEASSGSLDRALQDFSDVTDTIATASEDIAGFTSRLEGLSEQAESTLRHADTTMQEVTQLALRAEDTLGAGDAALASARRTFDGAGDFVEQELPALAARAEETLASLRAEVDRVGSATDATLGELRQAGAVATERLQGAEETIAAANAALADLSSAAASVEAAARSLDALTTGEGTAAVADLRGFIANADSVVAAALDVAETDLPAILADIRSATETAAGVVERVGADLSAAAGRADEISADAAQTLDTITGTFETANATLERLDTALETGERALTAAESAFTSADRVLDDEVGAMAADLRAMVGRLDAAIGSVSEDVPVITGALRETAERANAAFGQIEATAGQVGPPLREFAREGLPQYGRLARETRDLVANLDRLVRQIERDPARYFLGQEEPAYRR